MGGGGGAATAVAVRLGGPAGATHEIIERQRKSEPTRDPKEWNIEVDDLIAQTILKANCRGLNFW
jgi:hypothetical protein